MSRWISTPRPSFLMPSRALRTGVEPGSMAYSAVSQPPLPFRKGGTPSTTEAVHKTRVRPQEISTEPAAASVKSGIMVTSRNFSSIVSLPPVYSPSKIASD